MDLTQHRRPLVSMIAALLLGAATVAGVATFGSGREQASDAGTPAGARWTTGGTTPGATPSAPPATDPVIVPGRPGESAAVTGADEAARLTGPRHNPTDALFVQMMIPHHTQALRMAALAPERAADPRIRALADRIRASQIPEIQQLRGWLDAHGLADDRAGGHDHAGMPGMQSDAALRDLATARGTAFDRLFIEMMTDHHQGAIDMASGVLRSGVDITVRQLANSIATEQAVEIDRMRALAS